MCSRWHSSLFVKPASAYFLHTIAQCGRNATVKEQQDGCGAAENLAREWQPPIEIPIPLNSATHPCWMPNEVLRIVATHNPLFIKLMKVDEAYESFKSTLQRNQAGGNLGVKQRDGGEAWGHVLHSNLLHADRYFEALCLCFVLIWKFSYFTQTNSAFVTFLKTKVKHACLTPAFRSYQTNQDDKDWTVFHHLAYSNNLELMETILDQLGNDPVCLQEWLIAEDICGYTPIHVAAQFGSTQAFEKLSSIACEFKNSVLHKSARKPTKDGQSRSLIYTHCFHVCYPLPDTLI